VSPARDAVLAQNRLSDPRARSKESLEELSRLVERVGSRQLAGEELVPVTSVFADLLGAPGLRRGSSIVLEGRRGAVSIALGLIAKASADGMWCAVLGLPDLGLLAAHELGVALEHLVLVPTPGARFVAALSSLIDGFDVVVLSEQRQLAPEQRRRLEAKARERRCVLIVLAEQSPSSWATHAEARFRTHASRFVGIEQGSGRITGRLLDLEVQRRRSSLPTQIAQLWCPSPSGEIALETGLHRDDRRAVNDER
jgi:hypothetical protein